MATTEKRGRPSLSERNKARRAEFARRLQTIRQLAGLTQAQLGRLLGVTTKTVERWEGAERSVPVEVVWDMATALGVTLPYLLGAVAHADEVDELLKEQQPQQTVAA